MAKPQLVEEVQKEEEVVDTTSADIRASFDAAIAGEGSSEDQIKMDMIGAGATFKNVTRLYNEFMIDSGLEVSKEDRDAAVVSAVEGLDLATQEGFDSAIANILSALESSTDRSAAALVRGYAKKNELAVFAKPKSQGKGRAGFATSFYNFLIANPSVSVDEATAFIKGEGDHADTSDNTKKHLSHYLAIHKMANTIAAA